jgi:predicted nucleic acid-binding Zn ribbon protein
MSLHDPHSPCPICGTPRPANRASNQPWCCSIEHYRTFWGIASPETPSCHDSVTITCPVCQHAFVRTGRQKFCSDACRAAAYRRRRDARPAALVVPKARPRRPITVYECDGCGDRALGEQRCDTCNTWMRRIGLGGSCPHCDAPVAVSELVEQEVIATS